jgi:hypothetical protein
MMQGGTPILGNLHLEKQALKFGEIAEVREDANDAICLVLFHLLWLKMHDAPLS